jgi:hypothetical protein
MGARLGCAATGGCLLGGGGDWGGWELRVGRERARDGGELLRK